MNGLDVLAVAIARREGFYKPGTVPNRTHNPGDLLFRDQKGAKPHPVKGTDGKTRIYAEFADAAAGFAALKAQIRLDAGRGLTLAEFIGKYAPAADANDEKGYLVAVMTALGENNPKRLLAELIR